MTAKSGHGKVHWTELNSWDPAKAKVFYEALFGWRFTDMPMPEGDVYHVAHTDDGMACGIFAMSSPEMDGVPEHWLTYFEVADVDAACATVGEAGGAVMRPPFEVAGVGRFAIIRDANGAVSGVITPSKSESDAS